MLDHDADAPVLGVGVPVGFIRRDVIVQIADLEVSGACSADQLDGRDEAVIVIRGDAAWGG
jgi:hypothetical protein